MLILPLHRAPTFANLPWATLALIAVNLLVFFGLQSGDARREERALAYYAEAGLARWEFPAYRAWLEAHAQPERAADYADPGRAGAAPWLVPAMLADAAFAAELDAGRGVAADAPDRDEWRERHREFARLRERVFTGHWMLRFSEPDPRRILGAMFLHGGAGHLFGNLLFLALLGFLVEGALGPWLFLAVYLAGGFASALFSLAWRWGEHGSALGASGAIAALMGAYCVLWGRRRVRFFWWFFVAFDYVKAPALVLLPFWLGWEVVNLLWNTGAHVGFDAHAGGIVSGALLAAGVRALGWERQAFLDEDLAAEQAAGDRAAFAQARAHVGRLELAAARALLEPLARKDPHDFAVAALLYRCARYEPGMPRLRETARAALACPAGTAADAAEQKRLFDDYRAAAGPRLPLSAAETVALARRWPRIGAAEDAARLLAAVLARAPATPGLAAHALAAAREIRARGANAAAATLLAALVDAAPQAAEAAEARRLLAEVA